MELKYYYDIMSEPSRAMLVFLKHSKIPFQACPVSLRRGEQFSDEFKKINRFKKVPALVHGDFKLAESVAILRYVAQLYPKESELLYPASDLKSRAKIDEYLEWQHNNMRAFCNSLVSEVWLIPMRTFKDPSPERVGLLKNNMENCLEQFEELFVTNAGSYVAGDKITVADVFAACEIEQTKIAGYDPCKNHSVLAAWLGRVKSQLGPIYEETNAVLSQSVAKLSKL